MASGNNSLKETEQAMNQHHEPTDQEPMDMSGPSRMNAKTALRQAINRHERQVNSLTALLEELPGKLSPEADEALWQLAIRECR